MQQGDWVMDITEAEKIIYKVSSIYDDGECIIKAIKPNKDGVIITNNSINVNKLFLVKKSD